MPGIYILVFSMLPYIVFDVSTASDFESQTGYHGCYVAAKATYIRLLHGKIGFLGGLRP